MDSMNNQIWYAPNKFDSYGQEEIDAVVKCLNEGWLAGNGKYSKQFEKEIAILFDKKYALFVNSGSSANLLGLASLKLPKNSKIITPSCTFSTTVAPIVQLGFEPVFCDVGLNTYVPDFEHIVKLIDDDTKVIMIPDLIGNLFDWKRLREYLEKINRKDIVLFEDSADTIVKTTYSDISITSFYATHLITAGGTGGMVMFNDEKLYKKALELRDWGRVEVHDDNNIYECEKLCNRLNKSVDNITYDCKYLFVEPSYNMKCSEMSAAFGLEQLKKIDYIKEKRRVNFNKYMSELEELHNKNIIILPNDSKKSDWLAFPILVSKNRNGLMEFLEKNNIQSRVAFSGNITRHPAYRKYFQEFKNSDLIMNRGILVGIHQGLNFKDIEYVCSTIKKFVENL